MRPGAMYQGIDRADNARGNPGVRGQPAFCRQYL